MSLSSNVQARYPAQRLIEWTNPDNRAAVAIDTAVLDKAVADVEGDFLARVGVIYDDANKAHVSVAVEGVRLRLIQRLGVAKTDEDESRYFAGLAAVAKGQGGRQRVVPAALAQETRSQERSREDLQDFLPEDVLRDPDDQEG